MFRTFPPCNLLTDRFPTGRLLTGVLAAGALVAGALLTAGSVHAQAKGGDAPTISLVPTVRTEVATPMNKAQAAVAARNFGEALAALQEAEAVPNLTDDERFVITRTRLVAALGSGDLAAGAKSAEALRAGGRLPAAERAQISATVASTAFRAKQYAEAARWARLYRDDGGTDPQVQTLLVNALYLTPDYTAAATELQAELKATEAAGQVPAEERLRMLASAYAQTKDDPQYVAAIERLLVRYPKRDYWIDLVGRVGRKPGFNEGLVLDQYRLLATTAGLKTEQQYLEMAQLSMQAGYPIEARKVLDEGFEKGVLGQGAQAGKARQMRDTARREAASDEKRLADGSLKSANTKDGSGSVAFGLSYVIGGHADKGLAMMEEGLARGGLKRPDDARLRLGMAYALAGRKDKAAEVLAAVKGSDGPADLAHLWQLQLKAPPLAN